jgi:hypothetical protein
MPTQAIEIGLQTPVAAAAALKKTGYNVTSGGKNVTIGETEGETILDVFPELNDVQSQNGGEVKDIKNPPAEHLKKTAIPKEEIPKKVKRDEKMESKQPDIMKKLKGKVISKKEVLEVIRGGGAQPATQPGTAPTETPTIAPTKPGQKPQRKNPFHPKPGPNPHPKGQGILPAWMTSDKLGIGKGNNIQESKVKKIMEDAINKSDSNDDLMARIRTLRSTIIRLLHLQDVFAKSDEPKAEIENILKIIKRYKTR